MTELILTILAQAPEAAKEAAEKAPQATGILGFFQQHSFPVMMVLMFGIVYFMLIRPQQKKRKEQESWLSSLSRGDKVITQGGLVGKITRVDGRMLTLEVARGVQLKVLRSHIAGPDSASDGEKSGSGSKDKGK